MPLTPITCDGTFRDAIAFVMERWAWTVDAFAKYVNWNRVMANNVDCS